MAFCLDIYCFCAEADWEVVDEALRSGKVWFESVSNMRDKAREKMTSNTNSWQMMGTVEDTGWNKIAAGIIIALIVNMCLWFTVALNTSLIVSFIVGETKLKNT